MQSIHDIPMATLPIEDAAFAADPYPHLEAARNQHPWLARCSYGYLVFGYREIDDIYRMDDKVHFATDQIIEVMGAKGSPWGDFNEGLMITKQGAEHARLRGNVAEAFSPRNELEIDLLRFMLKRYDRVSVERIVAGPGFSEIYHFLIESGRGSETKKMKKRFAEAEDINAAITDAALAREDAAASRTLDLFVSMFGAVAGDLALITKSTGGFFVGGGIAPKILPRIREGEFMRAFRDKGRLSPLLEKIPVRVILEPRTALIGAAAFAAAQNKRSR